MQKWQDEETAEFVAEFCNITYKSEFLELPFRDDQVQTFSETHGFSLFSSLEELCKQISLDETIGEIAFYTENGYRVFKCDTKD